MDVCLALTLAGFCDSEARADAVIQKYEGAVGFIGGAHRAAKTAYERNIWSRAWYEKMLAAKEPVEFWQASLMLTKIVDARYDVWSKKFGPGGEPYEKFASTVRSEIERRIEKNQEKRKDKLFGDKAPSDILLES